MLKKTSIILVCLLTINLFPADKISRKILSNGMEVVVKENHQNQSVGFFCFVKTGSSNEGKFLGSGVSHYLEHLIAGGTTKFHTEADFKKMNQQSGAISNAYTNTKATVFHIITHKDFGDQTLANLAEQIRYCALDSFEVAREKEVILKEIVMGSTNPEDRIPERRDELLYQISNQKYPIIGFVETFKRVTRKDLVEYYHKHYVPNNMVFVAVGNFNADSMLAKIEKNFTGMPRGVIYPESQPAEPAKQGSLTIAENYDISLPKMYISYVLPTVSAKENFALSTALSLLFDKRESPINYKLTEELKMVNQIWAYSEAADNFNRENLAMIGLEARENQNLNKITEIIDTELKLAAKKGFTKEQISQAVQRLERARIVRMSDIDTEANEIGWNMLNYGVADYQSNQIESLKKLTPADLQLALQNFIQQGRFIYQALPISTIEKSVASHVKAENKPVAIKIDDRLSLIYKNSDSKPVIYGSILFPFGQDYETKENKGCLEMLNRIVIRGSAKYQPLWLSNWLEDKMVDLHIETYDYGTMLKFKCLKQDYPELEKIIIDLLKNPSFRSEELTMLKDEIEAEYQHSLNNPEAVHHEFLTSILYKGKKSALKFSEINQYLQKTTVPELKILYKKYYKADQIKASIIGDLSQAEAVNALKSIASAIPTGKIEAKIEADNPDELTGIFETEYPFEQVYLSINYPAAKIVDADFKIMLAIQNLLNGNIGLIFEAARGRNDLAYSAYSNYSYNTNKAFLRIETQTTIDKKDALLKELLAVMENLKTGKISQEEIDAGIADWQRSYENDMLDDYWTATYTRNAALGLGYDFVSNYKNFVGKITPEDVKRVASKYFKNAAIVVALPDESIERIVK